MNSFKEFNTVIFFIDDFEIQDNEEERVVRTYINLDDISFFEESEVKFEGHIYEATRVYYKTTGMFSVLLIDYEDFKNILDEYYREKTKVK